MGGEALDLISAIESNRKGQRMRKKGRDDKRKAERGKEDIPNGKKKKRWAKY